MILAAGRVVAAQDDIVPGHVVVEGDRIVAVGAGVPPGADYVFPEGMLLPGFVDLQVNGGAGIDLLEAGAGDVERLSGYLASTGVTGFLPTLVSAPPAQITRAVVAIRQARTAGAEILGLHLEGPALNPVQHGAHDPRSLAVPHDPAVRELYATALPDLRLVTLAPELPAALELITWLVERGAVVSLGHTNATYTEAKEAFERGARMVTHVYNAVRAFHHREPGLLGAAADAGAVCGLIADGIHVHPAAVRLAFHLFGAERIVLVSDAVAAAGMPPGRYRLGNRPIQVSEGDAPRLPDGGLAGSVLRMDTAVANVVRWGIPLRQAVRSASAVPAGVLGLDRGAITPGARADLTALGADGRTALTVVAGRVVYERAGGQKAR